MRFVMIYVRKNIFFSIFFSSLERIKSFFFPIWPLSELKHNFFVAFFKNIYNKANVQTWKNIESEVP